MAYTKTNWTEATAITTARLNNMETQYDEAAGYADAKRADADEILKCEIVATLPAAAQAHAGRIVFNQADGKFYGGTGTAWRVMRSASGDAAVGDVLAGKTFSNAASDGLTGTMPNRGAVVITPGTVQQAILAGYHDGAGYVEGDPNLVAENILIGKNLFGVAGSLSVIKSIQRGVVTTGTSSTNVSIAPVNLDYAIVQAYSGRYDYPDASSQEPNPYAYFTSSSQIRIVVKTNRRYTSAWEVVEFSPDVIQSIQKGVVNTGSSPDTTEIPINAVNPAKSMVIIGDYYASNSGDHARARIYLKDETTLELHRGRGSALVSAELHWQVIEFK